MEPPSPIQALGVNPFPSGFIIRTVPMQGRHCALTVGNANHNDEMTLLLWACTSSNSRKFGVDRPKTIILASET